MPISCQQYRISIGIFNNNSVYFYCNAYKHKNQAILSFLLSFLVHAIVTTLLLIAGVEPNPGPIDAASSTPYISGIFKPINNLSRTPERKRSDSLSSKRPREDSTPENLPTSTSSSQAHNRCEVYFQEIKSLLVQNTASNNEIMRRFEITDAKLSGLTGEITDLKTECEDLKISNKQLQRDISQLQEEIERQESYSRKNNLIFHNLPIEKTDCEKTCEVKVKEFLKSELGIEKAEEVLVDIAHILPSKGISNPSVIVKFTKRSDRNFVLNEYRSKNKRSSTDSAEQSSAGRVSEDFSRRVRSIRSKLLPIMRNAINEGRKVKLRAEKLCINNDWITFDVAENKVKNLGSEPFIRKYQSSASQKPVSIVCPPNSSSA